jgi:hypothetical protein
MPADMLTYGRITDRLSFSSAFQALVKRLWLPRQRWNDNGLMAGGLDAQSTETARSPEGDQSAVAMLTARIETLEADFAKVEAAAAMHRADFERERERCERLMAEVLKATAEMMAAREAADSRPGERGRGGVAWPAESRDVSAGYGRRRYTVDTEGAGDFRNGLTCIDTLDGFAPLVRVSCFGRPKRTPLALACSLPSPVRAQISVRSTRRARP